MRQRYDPKTGEWSPVHTRARDDVNAPYVISDEMLDNTKPHPCDGRIYTSKSEFRKVTAAHGCVELGNDRIKPTPHKKPPVADTIREIKEALGWRRDPKRHQELRRDVQRRIEHAENMRKHEGK